MKTTFLSFFRNNITIWIWFQLAVFWMLFVLFFLGFLFLLLLLLFFYKWQTGFDQFNRYTMWLNLVMFKHVCFTFWVWLWAAVFLVFFNWCEFIRAGGDKDVRFHQFSSGEFSFSQKHVVESFLTYSGSFTRGEYPQTSGHPNSPILSRSCRRL